MNRNLIVYDFDHTIYDGDCSIDLYKLALKKHPKVIAYLPQQLLHSLLFVLKLEDRKTFKSNFFCYLKSIDNVDDFIELFWDYNYKHMKRWYLSTKHDNDVIVSASPEFILAPVAKKLGVNMLIATKMDTKSAEIEGENCRGEQKLIRLNQLIREPNILRAYSDSLSDRPLLEVAKKAFIVNKNQLVPFKEYKKRSIINRLSLRRFFEESTLE